MKLFFQRWQNGLFAFKEQPTWSSMSLPYVALMYWERTWDSHHQIIEQAIISIFLNKLGAT
jgi:hypothetical protein